MAHSLRPLSIVMVSYNSYPMIKKNIECIQAQLKDIDYEVILADNASPDLETQAYLQEIKKNDDQHVKAICMNNNTGYSVALNVAVEYARHPIILTLDPDIYMDEYSNDALVKMYDLLVANLDYGMISPLLQKEDGVPDLNYDVHFDIPRMILERYKRIFSDRSKYKQDELILDQDGCAEVRFIAGACCLLRKSVYQNILGGYDERYFVYSSDTDLCLSAYFHGLRCMIYTKATFTHALSTSASKFRVRMMYDMYKSFSQLLLKWYVKPFVINSLYRIVFVLPVGMELFVRYLKGNKKVSD